MKFNCGHFFTLEASDRSEFDEKLRHYGDLVRRASDRLDIGYEHLLVTGQPAAYAKTMPEPDEPDEPVERLFDE